MPVPSGSETHGENIAGKKEATSSYHSVNIPASSGSETPTEDKNGRDKEEAVKNKVYKCPVNKALKDHTGEFEKKIYKVTDGVHVAVGYALANSILVVAPDGMIVIDTTECSERMTEIWQEFRTISGKPLKAVIYTNHQADHTGGTEALVGDKSDIEIWAHRKFLGLREYHDTMFKGFMVPRTVRAYAINPLVMPPTEVPNVGIGPALCCHRMTLVWPNKFMEGEGVQDLNIAGLHLQLVYIPGQTECHMGVWIPSKKVFMPGEDIYRTFPNTYSIRGTRTRNVIHWINSLDTMRKLRPEHLVPTHTRPLSGQAEIHKQLTCYRDGIQFVHDQTLRLMNRNMHPVEIAKAIKLPPSQRKNPFLQPFLCLAEWSSRAIFGSYIGWFSGNPEELFPFTPTERGQRMVKAFGAKNILQQAKAALTDDLQWALELSSHVFLSDPTNEKAKDIRKHALLTLAEQQTSALGRNYFLHSILEDHGIAPK